MSGFFLDKPLKNRSNLARFLSGVLQKLKRDFERNRLKNPFTPLKPCFKLDEQPQIAKAVVMEDSLTKLSSNFLTFPGRGLRLMLRPKSYAEMDFLQIVIILSRNGRNKPDLCRNGRKTTTLCRNSRNISPRPRPGFENFYIMFSGLGKKKKLDR